MSRREMRIIIALLYVWLGIGVGILIGALLKDASAWAPSQAVAGALDDAALREGIVPACLWSIAYRESRYLPWVDNFQGSGAAGLFQFMPGTWRFYAPQAGYSGDPALRYDAWAAAHVAAWMIARPRQTGGLSHWGGRC